LNLKGKKAVVTGGSRGIGKGIVLELASKGCDVVFTYNSNEEAAKAVENDLSELGVEGFGIKADASSFETTQETMKNILEKFGRVDILVNNAGITKDNPLFMMSENDFDSVIDANLKSVFNYTKAVLRPMIKQRYGRIINISSVVAITGNPGQANYVASKAGVIGMTKSNAKELASRNITVNAVCPGFIETDMTGKLNDQQKDAMLKTIPLARFGKSEDIAKVVSFLVSDSADYITGQVIAVDGGMVM